MTINEISYDIFPGTLRPTWVENAAAKGFDIVARIADRFHLALRCRTCGETQKVRLFTLMAARPLCMACLMAERREDAVAAGLQFLRRDPQDRHYAIYRAPCGHEVRRQSVLVKRVAAGEISLHCDTCHAATEAAEAESRGWILTGDDPDGNPNYRRYEHGKCGHEKRVARANMQTGRVQCGGCGEDWPAAPSYIYAMNFTLATGREVTKLGFSRNPISRLRHQLQRDAEMPCQLLRAVPMTSGHAALCAEKAMHRLLRQEHPDAVVNPIAWQGQIRVKTEIYCGSLTPVILGMLDRLETDEMTV